MRVVYTLPHHLEVKRFEEHDGLVVAYREALHNSIFK